MRTSPPQEETQVALEGSAVEVVGLAVSDLSQRVDTRISENGRSSAEFITCEG